MLSKGAVEVSLFSSLHSHHGWGIVSHEMGHLLSWLSAQNELSDGSDGSYTKLRECATGRYKRLKAPSRHSEYAQYYENDQWNTEEDTADLIAYLAVSESQTRYTCSLLSITEDGVQYKGLNILNTDLKDHSAPLLRVLFEAIHKREELPPACQEVMDQYKDEINFEPCF